MFHGSLVALVTPMDKDQCIDYSCMSQLIEMHIDQKTDGIVVLGTTGEAASLTPEEKHQVIRHTEQQVAERVPVIAGTYATGTQPAISFAEMAMHEGVDAVLIMTPAYIKPTQEGLYQHYLAIANAVAIPQIMYNVPSRTGVDLLPETIARLAHISNIIGVKEATGNIGRCSEILNSCGNSIDVYSGDDSSAMALMFAGAKGVISVTANVAPQSMQQMCHHALDGNKTAALAIDKQLYPLHKSLFVESNPIPVKWALTQMGLIPPGIRLPLTPLATQYHAIIRQAMTQSLADQVQLVS